MAVPYTPLAIANAFIEMHGKRDGIEHMKLQKLVYYSYGWWLASNGLASPRLTSEGPEIWKHGPVFSSLYAVLKIFGRTPIVSAQSPSPFGEPDNIKGDNRVATLVDWVWRRYGHLSSFALSDMTHRAGTSWYRTAVESNYSVPLHTMISDQYIFEEFSALKHAEYPDTNGEADGVEHSTITA